MKIRIKKDFYLKNFQKVIINIISNEKQIKPKIKIHSSHSIKHIIQQNLSKGFALKQILNLSEDKNKINFWLEISKKSKALS